MKFATDHCLVPIKLVVLDVDGVLTDGGLYYDGQGIISQRFSVHDGLVMKILQDKGIAVAILTAGGNPSVKARAKNLNINHVYTRQHNKREGIAALWAETGIAPEHTLYVGDDLIDLNVMAAVGVSVAVANAVAEVKAAADIVLTTFGGHGAVREIGERILKAQGRWAEVVAAFQNGVDYVN